MKTTLLYENKEAGEVRWEEKGLYVSFWAESRVLPEPVGRVWLVQGDRRLALGVVCPEGGVGRLQKSLSKSALRQAGLTDGQAWEALLGRGDQCPDRPAAKEMRPGAAFIEQVKKLVEEEEEAAPVATDADRAAPEEDALASEEHEDVLEASTDAPEEGMEPLEECATAPEESAAVLEGDAEDSAIDAAPAEGGEMSPEEVAAVPVDRADAETEAGGVPEGWERCPWDQWPYALAATPEDGQEIWMKKQSGRTLYAAPLETGRPFPLIPSFTLAMQVPLAGRPYGVVAKDQLGLAYRPEDLGENSGS